MLAEEAGDFTKGFLGLGDPIIELILCVGLTFEYNEFRIDSRSAQLAMLPDGIAE